MVYMQVKKEIMIGLMLALGALVFILVIAGNYIKREDLPKVDQNIAETTTSPTEASKISVENPIEASSATVDSIDTTIKYTMTEIAKHNSEKDCWLLIDNEVQDVTSYMSKHPGGKGWILPYCGKDATVAFSTKGGEGSHSEKAYGLLDSLYVGDLSE